jgi:predicted acyltransferase
MLLTHTRPTAKLLDIKSESALQTTHNRVTSIDNLRALTMLLMIFVNDLGTLKNIPVWLEHVPADADGMGLADTVFPAFLFIVGMSIPYSVAARRKQGDDNLQLLRHIASRSIALLVMGVFLVNGENINATATGLSGSLWNTLSCISFILIWNTYLKTINPFLKRTLQGIGAAILLTLAFLFQGGNGEQLKGFSTYWWGILGLIGWCYLTSSVITALAEKRKLLIVAAWLLFVALSLVSTAGLLQKDGLLRIIPSPIIGGTLIAFTLGGVLTTLLYQKYQKQSAHKLMMTILLIISVCLLGLGIYTNQFWDISKIRATAPWLFLCGGFTILAFIALYWLSDVKGKAGWFEFIRPAGTNTLLCYLIPYFAYALIRASGFTLPEMIITGIAGLLKSFVFALLSIWITGMLVKNGIKLKL